MKALVKHHRGFGASLEYVNIPIIKKNEVLIRVKATSICGTDVHIYKWDQWANKRVKPPYIFGHEFSGVVIEIGSSVSSVSVGDHVSAETHIICHNCLQCLEGLGHICRNTKIIGVDQPGCFAEYIAVPEQNVWKNPKDLTFEVASIQEPMGNAAHTVLTGEIVGKSVAIIGCGPIGLMAIAISKAAGASQILAIDVNEYRLQLAKQMGATSLINSLTVDAVQKAEQITHNQGVDVICEMSGHPQAIKQGFEMVANGGRVSILSLPEEPVALDITNQIVFKGLNVQGITGRLLFKTWNQVSRLIRSKQVDVLPLLTHSYPLEEFKKGFDLMLSGNCGKVILYP
ncbi:MULTISPECIES: L-threonine 3-dehydrogenase [Bacillus]|uniref:L-threonine 3-dehydrogenase n=1 Tax=Bacillus TaxID=1386 RepID=UPI0003020136|nr:MULTISPECIES: L-threonine 3-dehydrogenase [Bacillus]